MGKTDACKIRINEASFIGINELYEHARTPSNSKCFKASILEK